MFTNIILTIKDLFFTIYWIAYVFVITIKGGIISEIIHSLLEKILR